MKTKTRPAKPGVTAATRSEDPKDPEKKEPESAEDPEKKEPPTSDKMECLKCGAANDKDAKYCDKCGEPMGDGMEATAEDPDGDGDGDGEKKKKPEASRADSDGDGDDDDGDGDGDKGARSEPPPENRRAAAAPSHAGSLASIFGLREGASTPAIKSAAIAFVNLGRAVMSATETKSPSEAQGALRSILEDAAEVADLRASLAASKKREVRREKMDLLMKLAAKNLPGYPRGELLVDREVGGKRVVGPAPMFDEMPIATLRGFVNGKLKGQAATGPERTPFDPDPNRARTSTENALVEGDLATPFIQDIASRSSASPEQLAKTARALEAQGVR